MNKEKIEALCGNISLLALIIGILLVLVSFFFQPQMWLFISGVSGIIAVMKFCDAVKDYQCDKDLKKGHLDTMYGMIFVILAVILLFV